MLTDGRNGTGIIISGVYARFQRLWTNCKSDRVDSSMLGRADELG